ncbi:MAG TPA: glycogen/starch synthase [Phycisphaerae bacterium]|nr:glycogen/starch synthase [Phycisphaerae bacterium]
MENNSSDTGMTPIGPAPGGNGDSSRPLIIEVSWEVCAQAGGIYTVLRSKSPAAVRRWGDQYWLIGPYRESAAAIEFELDPPGDVVARAVESLRDRGIIVHCGRWLITGRPRVMLIDLPTLYGRLGEMKYFLWKDHGISIPDSDGEMNDLVIFGYACAELLQAIHEHMAGRPMLAHFHEWQSAVSLPVLRHRGVYFPTIFTTHATLVGRSLSAANANLYDHLDGIDGHVVAHKHQFEHRFLIEKAAAHSADVFTTVSGITAIEARQFLGRQPEVLLPNGLNVERFAAPYEFQNLHRRCKQLIHEFTMGHFFSSYTFDLEKTLYLFCAGRHEYRNKGFDVFIEALHLLNHRLKNEQSDTTVVAFLIAPAPYRALNVDTLKRQAMFNELRETCESIKDDMGERMFRTLADGRMPTLNDLLDEYARVRMKRITHAWRQYAQPTIVTHDLHEDWKDPILCHLRHRQLLNAADDPVKVVFHPEFITSTSPVLGIEYDQFVRGCNLGVFPSYYEPWGYTPMECVIRGIPAITSDLSGFGAYAMSHFPDHDENGIYVARRRGRSFDETVTQITHWLHDFTQTSRRDRIQLRNRVEAYAEHFDWEHMGRYYRVARRWAFQKYYPDLEIFPPEPQPEVPAGPPRAPTGRSKSKRARARGSAQKTG